MHDNARRRVKAKADGCLTTHYERDEVFVTNTQATGFLAKWSLLEELTGRIEALESEKAKGQEALEVLEEKARGQERDSRIEALEQKFRPEDLVRQRFISNFIKKDLQGPSAPDHNWIERGNATAHFGDCYSDAHLYVSGNRAVINVFETLYGFVPCTILSVNRKFLFLFLPGPQ